MDICSNSKSDKPTEPSHKHIKTLKGVLPKIDSLELLKTTYPYSIMGSYSKLSKTTSFEFDESKFIRLEKRREEMISNLELKSLDAREILMYNKVDEVNNLNISKTTKDAVFNNLWKI